MEHSNDKDHQAESRRILKQLRQEEGGVVGRATQRAREHLEASDADRDDWAEYWGTRIGRILGLTIMIGLAVWLLVLVTG